jgi:hypothetical protein
MVPEIPLPDRGRRVRALSGTLTRLNVALALSAGEIETAQLLDQIEAITACLTDAPANDLDDMRAKVSVLRHRLEEQLCPDHAAEALTLALTASVLRDLDRMAA